MKKTLDQQSVVRQILVEQLVLSPEETRKTIDQAALAELAKSIATSGVIEALLVRPDAAIDNDNESRFEIVAGQRRWLASKQAGKKTCPCIVREMSDDEARQLRVISNLQREDLPPMEEAEAYGKLLELPGATIETVAAALAKTPSYVGRRVQLLKVIDPVRAALKAGAIEVGHALELARLSEGMQGEFLRQLNVGGNAIGPNDVEDESGEPGTCRFCGCTEDNACAAGCSWANEEETICDSPKCLAQFRSEIGEDAKVTYRRTLTSVAELKNMVERQSLRVLSSAPFPLDHDLAPMPCTDCPKRSTNAVLLFDDCAQDTCTDRRCYDAKVGAWVQAELVLAKSEKRKLLKLTQSWSSDKERIQVSDYSGAKLVRADHICESQEEGIWVDGEDIGQRASICRNQKCETHYGKRSSSSSSSHRVQSTEKEKADRRKILDKVKSAKAYRSALVTAIAAASVDTRTLESLQIDVCCAAIAKTNSLYAAHLARAIGWDEKLLGWNGRTQLRAKVTELSTVRRFLIARLCEEAGELSVNEYNASGKCEDLEKLAKLVGVDSKKLKIVDAAAKPEKAAAPAKAVKVKKAVLSAAARKRIAAAQKKRWSAVTKKKAVRK